MFNLIGKAVKSKIICVKIHRRIQSKQFVTIVAGKLFHFDIHCSKDDFPFFTILHCKSYLILQVWDRRLKTFLSFHRSLKRFEKIQTIQIHLTVCFVQPDIVHINTWNNDPQLLNNPQKQHVGQSVYIKKITYVDWRTFSRALQRENQEARKCWVLPSTNQVTFLQFQICLVFFV